MQNMQLLSFLCDLSLNWFVLLSWWYWVTSDILHYSLTRALSVQESKNIVFQWWYHANFNSQLLLTLVCPQTLCFAANYLFLSFPRVIPCARAFSNPLRLILLLAISTNSRRNRTSVNRLFSLALCTSFAIRFYWYLCPQRLSWNCTWRCQQTLLKESCWDCSSSRKLWQRSWHIHYFHPRAEWLCPLSCMFPQCSRQC